MQDENLIPERVNVLGVGIHPVNPQSAREIVFSAVHEPGTLGYVTVTGVHGVVESQDDEALQIIHNRSFLSVPDGTPMTWMGRLQGKSEMRQVAGPDFFPAVIEQSCTSGERHFLWGGGEGVVDLLKEKLLERHPTVKIAGTVSPPFRPLNEEEERELVAQIKSCKPHFFWVGLSTPKQEKFMSAFIDKYRDELTFDDQGLLFFGVGAAFDFQAGLVKECPRWLRGSGFEWFYRMCMDPKRLVKRYMRSNPRFLWGAFLQLSRLKKYPCKDA